MWVVYVVFDKFMPLFRFEGSVIAHVIPAKYFDYIYEDVSMSTVELSSEDFVYAAIIVTAHWPDDLMGQIIANYKEEEATRCVKGYLITRLDTLLGMATTIGYGSVTTHGAPILWFLPPYIDPPNKSLGWYRSFPAMSLGITEKNAREILGCLPIITDASATPELVTALKARNGLWMTITPEIFSRLWVFFVGEPVIGTKYTMIPVQEHTDMVTVSHEYNTALAARPALSTYVHHVIPTAAQYTTEKLLGNMGVEDDAITTLGEMTEDDLEAFMMGSANIKLTATSDPTTYAAKADPEHKPTKKQEISIVSNGRPLDKDRVDEYADVKGILGMLERGETWADSVYLSSEAAGDEIISRADSKKIIETSILPKGSPMSKVAMFSSQYEGADVAVEPTTEAWDRATMIALKTTLEAMKTGQRAMVSTPAEFFPLSKLGSTGMIFMARWRAAVHDMFFGSIKAFNTAMSKIARYWSGNKPGDMAPSTEHYQRALERAQAIVTLLVLKSQVLTLPPKMTWPPDIGMFSPIFGDTVTARGVLRNPPKLIAIFLAFHTRYAFQDSPLLAHHALAVCAGMMKDIKWSSYVASVVESALPSWNVPLRSDPYFVEGETDLHPVQETFMEYKAATFMDRQITLARLLWQKPFDNVSGRLAATVHRAVFTIPWDSVTKIPNHGIGSLMCHLFPGLGVHGFPKRDFDFLNMPWEDLERELWALPV